jgi:GNAT superfamily N-acetyltransferase
MEISRVDPRDPDAVQAFYEIYRAVGIADAPETFVAAPIEEIQTALAQPTARFEFSAFLGHIDGQPVASGWTAGFLKENTDHMFVLPRVLPSERRRGYGSQILSRIEAHARDDSRTVLDGQSRWAWQFGPSGTDAPTVKFAGQHGFSIALVEVIRRLDLPLDPQRATQIANELASAQGYSIQSWIGPVPDQFLEGWAVMEAGVSSDAPTGEVDLEAETPSPEAVRDDERILKASGQTSVGAIAVDEAGEVVAYTEMVVQLETAEPARQGGTLVKASHRGRRLGLAVKSAVIDLIQQERPDVPATLTQTAIENKHMIAINALFGYQPIEYIGDFQKRF